VKQIAFFDIDGTLYGFDGTKHRIPDSTVLAIKKFREKGNLAFICTGRPLRFIYQTFGDEMFDGYISANGTYIVYNGECIFDRPIDSDTINKLLNSFNELKIRGIFIGPYEGYPYKLNSEEILQYSSQFKGDEFLVKEWKSDHIHANAFDIFYNDELQLNKCRSYFSGSLVFNTHGAHMSADVSFKDFDKSSGIKYVSNFLNIPLENTIAFGDGYNDITMFETVKQGIAMGNAVNELKKVASYVTDDIFADGLYNAMINLGYIEK
jgi:HAD-superfamily hydrolase, subfamily IIB